MAFTETGEARFPMYSVYNIQLTGKSLDIKEVGTWKSGNLEIKSPIKMYDRKGKETAKHIPSTCTENCHECLHTVDRISEIPGGDVQLLGVFNAHSKGSNGRECSKSVDEIGVLAEVEGFLYAVDQINNDPTILPDVKLGATVLDDCAFSPVRTFRQISRFLVKNDESAGKNGFAPVLGSVTALSSNAAIYTQDILEVYGVPQISYRSSSPLLSDKKKYPNFLRVIGSDQYQVEAFIDILKASKWTSVIAIYSDNAYGLEGSRLLLKLAQEEGITVSTLVKMNDDIASDSNAIRDIIRYISSGFRAQVQVVIMFTTAEHTRAILAGKDREKDLPRKTWFGGDGWGTELGIVSGLEETAEGAVTLDFFSAPVDGFNKYLTTLSPFKNSRNVWFREFWEQKFECFIADRTFKEPCQDDRLTPEDIAPFQGRVAFITDIVRLYAKGLEQLMADFCPMTPSKLCVNAVKNLNKVTTYIKDSEFTGSSGLEVAFDSFDDAIPSYQINTFQELSRNKYGYINVGQWVNGNLLLEHISADTIVSSCSKPPCRTTSPDVLDLQFHPQPQDFTLIGLFPLYGFDTCGNTCDGELRHEIYHSLLGFYYAIDQINKKAAIILQGSKLGYVVYNTCSSPTVASDVVNGFDAKYPYFSQPPEVPVRTGVLGMVAGFEKNESDAISEARREQQHLVQISPVKEGSKTDGVIGVPHVVKDTTTLLVNVLFRLQWTHVSIVASNEKASLDLALILKNDIERRTFIIGTFLTVNGTSASDYDDVIAKLVKAGAPNVVTFANADDSRQLLLAAERQDTAGRLLWINAGQWKYPKMVVDGLDEVMKGSLILVPDAVLDADFDSFTKTLTPDSFPDDPWYAEFWEKHFQCALTFGGKFPNACTGDESFERRPLPPMPVTANTAKAVYAYADGLAKFYLYKCGRVDFEGCLGQVNGDAKDVAELYKEVRLVLDEGVDDPVLNFRYEYKILNFQKLKDGSFGYATVGSWYKGKLSLSPSDVQRYDSLEKGALLPPPPPLPARSPNLRGYYKHFLNR
ncbi:uncharacterized protein LOC106155577 [Lingula anatina]|uniref:Uncharacterized protein LOC106155577 n=1 Tax=Lingula anatina TaxID=7574 RepID=A0A1S3HKD5_LINAN|nr:uncharacterized protein LOC106155577 [Lingula anatina]|eukprot:XP_013385926.1 uncharacterized protein LOC106155577 [Lingula anatina]